MPSTPSATDPRSALLSLVHTAEASGTFEDAVNLYTHKVGPLDPALRARLLALLPDHPIRLGLLLNYAVSHYEIIKETLIADRRAQEAFYELLSALDQLDEAWYKDGQLIKQLIKDNLEKWKNQGE